MLAIGCSGELHSRRELRAPGSFHLVLLPYSGRPKRLSHSAETKNCSWEGVKGPEGVCITSAFSSLAGAQPHGRLGDVQFMKWFDEQLSTRDSISEQSILSHSSLCQSLYQYRTVLRHSSLRPGLVCHPRVRQVPPTLLLYFTNGLGNPWPLPFHTNSRMFLSTSVHSGWNFQWIQLSLFFSQLQCNRRRSKRRFR